MFYESSLQLCVGIIYKMKQFLLLIIISILFAVFTVQKNNSLEFTQLVVTIPELTNSDLQKNLEIDLNNINITAYNMGNDKAIDFGRKLIKYIEKSRLNKELKDSLCKAAKNFP